MNHILQNPKGADRVAQKIQNKLYSDLDWANVDSYGLTEKNFNKKGKPVIEAYVGQDEYRDVFLNDDKNASIFMVDDNEHISKDGIIFRTKISIVFMLNLKRLYPEATHRPKQEAELKAISTTRKIPQFKFSGLNRGVRESLGNFFYNDLIAFDMHPYYTFSIQGEIKYTVSCLTD